MKSSQNKWLHYFKLLFGSFHLFWESSSKYTLILFLIIPLQGIIPTLSITFAKNTVDIITQSVNTHKFNSSIIFPLVSWIITYIIAGILNPVSTYVQGGMTDKLINKINLKLMNKSNEIKDISYFEKAEFYDEIQILQEEAAWRPVNLIVFFLDVLKGLITMISAFVLLAEFNLFIALLLFLSLIPQTIVHYKLQEEAFENMVTKSPLARKLKYYASLLLSNKFAYESRMFAYGKHFTQKYRNTFEKIHTDSMKIRKKQLLSSLLWGTIGTLLGSAAFYWLIMKTVEGQFTAGDILAFTSVIVLTSQTLLALVQESSLLYDTLLYIEKFKNFLKLKSGVVSGNERLKHGIKTIEFQSVSFKYPKSERYALKDISFQLNKGEKTALVGENGSGKSTVMKLICRLYDVSEGRILVNNRDIKTYDIDSLRKEIGIVFQDYSKYHLSLRENIAVSDIESFADNEKLRYAAEKSNVSELMTSYRIDFEQILGKTFSGGKELSEGEWQKIAISRAYFKQNSLFLFDEPSSALDAISENTFFENVKQLSENKTVLFVTHKLSGATLSDKIIVLDNGRKIEEGHHLDLMKLKGKYSRLFSLQAERYL